MACPRREAAHEAEVELLLEEDAGKPCRIGTAIAATLEDEGAVRYVGVECCHGIRPLFLGLVVYSFPNFLDEGAAVCAKPSNARDALARGAVGYWK